MLKPLLLIYWGHCHPNVYAKQINDSNNSGWQTFYYCIYYYSIKEFTSYHLFILCIMLYKHMQCGKVSFLVQIIIVLHFQVMHYKGLPIWASLKNCCIIFDHSIVEIGSNAVQGLLGPKIKKRYENHVFGPTKLVPF